MGVEEEEEREAEKKKKVYIIFERKQALLNWKEKIPSVCDSILKKKKCKSDGS